MNALEYCQVIYNANVMGILVMDKTNTVCCILDKKERDSNIAHNKGSSL